MWHAMVYKICNRKSVRGLECWYGENESHFSNVGFTFFARAGTQDFEVIVIEERCSKLNVFAFHCIT